MSFTVGDAIEIIQRFEPGPDGLAAKSKDLSLDLLRCTASPFWRDQFTPGHLTCTALVLHPREKRVLLMHHHRLHRWLLPGGHIEKKDTSLAFTASREAEEETNVQIDSHFAPFLAGIDVHGIPPKRDEPFHLHHDLIWCFRAKADAIETTAEAPQVIWAPPQDFARLDVAESIVQSINRANRE